MYLTVKLVNSHHDTGNTNIWTCSLTNTSHFPEHTEYIMALISIQQRWPLRMNICTGAYQ